MSSVEFRVALILVAAIILAQIAYVGPRSAEVATRERASKFGWIANLSPAQRRVFTALTLVLLACGLAGIVGMFFFSRIAAIAFLGATLIQEIGDLALFRGGQKQPLEWALAFLAIAGSLLVAYLALFGPAKELFA